MRACMRSYVCVIIDVHACVFLFFSSFIALQLIRDKMDEDATLMTKMNKELAEDDHRGAVCVAHCEGTGTIEFVAEKVKAWLSSTRGKLIESVFFFQI